MDAIQLPDFKPVNMFCIFKKTITIKHEHKVKLHKTAKGGGYYYG